MQSLQLGGTAPEPPDDAMRRLRTRIHAALRAPQPPAVQQGVYHMLYSVLLLPENDFPTPVLNPLDVMQQTPPRFLDDMRKMVAAEMASYCEDAQHGNIVALVQDCVRTAVLDASTSHAISPHVAKERELATDKAAPAVLLLNNGQWYYHKRKCRDWFHAMALLVDDIACID